MKLPLLVVIGVGALLRLSALGWGIPPYDETLGRGTDLRASYHPDEDRMLWQLERMRPEVFDFNPKDFGWGTLQTYLVGVALVGAERAGFFPIGWRDGFRKARAGDLPRIFKIGRFLSALFGVLTLLVVYELARERGGEVAGLWAAAFLAVAPLHVVSSHFLTTDVPLAFWLSLSLLLLSRSHTRAAGFVAGLALATKSSALFFLPVLAFAHATRRPRAMSQAYLAVGFGFLLGQPYALLAFSDWWAGMVDLLRGNTISSAGTGPWGLYASHFFQTAYYGVGPVTLGLALFGFAKDRRARGLLLAAAAFWFLSLGLSWVPMARYEIPLLPWLAAAAGLAVAGLPRRSGIALSALALAFPLTMSVSQWNLLRAQHTGDAAARWVEETVPPGTTIAQLWYEYPVIDRNRYRVSLFDDPFDFYHHPRQLLEAQLVIVDNLPIFPLRADLRADLAANYREVVSFRTAPPVGPFVLPEPAAPHDWKYTHPEITFYERREGLARPAPLETPARGRENR